MNYLARCMVCPDKKKVHHYKDDAQRILFQVRTLERRIRTEGYSLDHKTSSRQTRELCYTPIYTMCGGCSESATDQRELKRRARIVEGNHCVE